MAAEELIERVLAGDVDSQTAPASPRASPHLLEARDGSREADADRCVELADIDTQLQRVGRDHPEQLAHRQPTLDVLPLRRGVSGAIGSDALRKLGFEPIDRVAQDQLDSLARLDEADRAGTLRDELGEELGCLIQRRCAQPELLVEQRRVPHRDVTRRLRRGVVIDEVERLKSREPLGKLDRVSDRRARQQEPRLTPMDRRRTTQATQHIADVRAEYAPVHVGLVDNHERQVRQQLSPRGVVGQDPDVKHVGVGEDQVAALADRGSLVARRVAVVDRRADGVTQPEGMKCPRLVLGERFRRIQVERPGSWVDAQHLKRGQLKTQRLARGRAGGNDRRSLEGGLDRVGLVGVQPGDPEAIKCGANRRAQPLRDRNKARFARPINMIVNQPLVGAPRLQQGRPGLGFANDRHRLPVWRRDAMCISGPRRDAARSWRVAAQGGRRSVVVTGRARSGGMLASRRRGGPLLGPAGVERVRELAADWLLVLHL